MLRDLRAFLSWRSDDAILLAEANVQPQTDMQYFGDAGERMQMMFNFQVNQHLFHALAAADATPLAAAMERHQAETGDRAVGRTSCATTTSSIWDG